MRTRLIFALLVVLLTWSMYAAQATQSSSPAASSGTEILFLGTAGGPPLRLDRSEPSTVLIVDGRPYLIDCGSGTMRRMLEAHIHSEDIKTIFFTHLHSDHDLGLADVMANDFFRLGLARSAPSIHIYGPPQTKELVDAAFRYITITVRPFASENSPDFPVVKGEFASPFVAHEINGKGVIFQDDKIRVTAAENTHYVLMPAEDRKQMKSYSYRIDTPHGAVVFTGDTGPSDAVARLAKGADVLVAEASYRDPADLDRLINSMFTQNRWSPSRVKAFGGHFEFEHLDTKAIGELAAKAQVKSVLLYHYDPINHEGDEAGYIRGVKIYFTGPVFAPGDLDRYCLLSADAKSTDNANLLVPCETSAQSTKPTATRTSPSISEKPNPISVSAGASCPSCCTMPVSERTEEQGCYVIANEALESLPSGPLFWHLYTYPTVAAASQAQRSSSGTVAESFGKVWVFNLAPAEWKPAYGERVAIIGSTAGPAR